MPSSNPCIEVALVERPVDYDEFEPFPAVCGAECVFLGRTRVEEHPVHGRLTRLSYEAYRSMAEQVLASLAETAARRWTCAAVRIAHALGDVPPGAASVIVQVAAGHRAEAFEACRYLIDELKSSAPIWKREEWADGTTWAPGAPARAPEGRSS